jgi:hypothetical protein
MTATITDIQPGDLVTLTGGAVGEPLTVDTLTATPEGTPMFRTEGDDRLYYTEHVETLTRDGATYSREVPEPWDIMAEPQPFRLIV